MDGADQEPIFNASDHFPPPLVSLVPFSPIHAPTSRRLSSNFTQPSPPIRSARRLSWISLQGRLVNAEEASSARVIGGGLSGEEAVAWELFSPIERFLIVAVIGVAVADSKKDRQMCQLKKAVELRDQVLLSMQQKLDVLCEQVNHVKDQPRTEKLPCHEAFGCDKFKFVDCGCWLCDQHRNLFWGGRGITPSKSSKGDEILQYKFLPGNEAEQEERRMSDLSDWASSVASTAEIHLNSLAIEQDTYNLKKDCDEKDVTIKELTALLHASDVSGSKRITELEDIIRRKNMIISKLKKDMLVLEQQVVQLTRLRRPSSSASESNTRQLPHLTDNLLYDMDSSTSPSSSDSDGCTKERSQMQTKRFLDIPIQNTQSCSIQNQKSVIRNQKSVPPKASISLMRPTDGYSKSRSVGPLKEISTNCKSETVSSSRQRDIFADSKRSRRRSQAGSKDATPQKKWV